MWYTNVSRRELLEILMTGALPQLREFESISSISSVSSEEFGMVWLRRPTGKVDELPHFIVAEDRQVEALLATINATPQIPMPFTAFCRVMGSSELSILGETPTPVRKDVSYGLAGLALAEAAIYSGASVRPTELSPAACKRTLSFTYARALNQLPVDALPRVIRNWLDTQEVLGLASPSSDRVAKALSPILDVATRIFHGLPPEDPISCAVSESLELGQPSEGTWSELTGKYLRSSSMKDFAEWTREGRSAAFQDVVRSIYSSSNISNEAAVSSALAATRISPGTLEHLGLLSQHVDPRVPLWYSFFAALQRHGAALRTTSGIGLRILRDINKLADIGGAPIADISSYELRVQARGGLDRVGRRLGHANEILVEVFPGLDASFRFGSRAEKSTLVSGSKVDAEASTLSDRVRAASRMLDELSKDLERARMGDPIKKTTRKKSGKTDTLF